MQLIFANATTSFRQPRNLRTLVESIDGLDWYSAKSEGLGDMYEGLLEKNAEETKSGAGQYFTPRPLIECIVDRVQPQAGELVQDPAIGTGGFLVAADRFIRARTDDLYTLSEKLQGFQRTQAFYGWLVPGVQRLALMNALLHSFEPDILLGDTLGPGGGNLPKADVILTNRPPHHPRPADRHLLRAGGEDERPLLHAWREGQGQHQGGVPGRAAAEPAHCRDRSCHRRAREEPLGVAGRGEHHGGPRAARRADGA